MVLFFALIFLAYLISPRSSLDKKERDNLVLAYRQFKSKEFICLASAAILTIARIIGIEGLNRYHNWLHDGTIYIFEQWILELLQIGNILAVILLGAGIVFIVQSISSKSGQLETM